MNFWQGLFWWSDWNLIGHQSATLVASVFIVNPVSALSYLGTLLSAIADVQGSTKTYFLDIQVWTLSVLARTTWQTNPIWIVKRYQEKQKWFLMALNCCYCTSVQTRSGPDGIFQLNFASLVKDVRETPGLEYQFETWHFEKYQFLFVGKCSSQIRPIGRQFCCRSET